MKKSAFLILPALIILLISAASASDIPDYYDKYVNDFANFLSADETGALREIFIQIEQNTTAEVVVAVIESASPYVPSDYAMKIFDKWGIGKSGKDNGLLILYVVKENKIWVSAGYGLEGILPDSRIGRMLDDYYVPFRDSNQTKQGIINFAAEIAKVLNENQEEIASGKAGEKLGSKIADSKAAVFIIIAFLILIFLLAKDSLKKVKTGKDRAWSFIRIGLEIVAVIVALVATNIILIIIAVIALIILSGFGRTSGARMRHHGAWAFSGGGGGGGGFGGGGFGGGAGGGGGAGR